MPANKPKDIDAYISGFPPNVQKILLQIRHEIKAAAPEAKETIKYDMPTFILTGNLVHFAAFKNHIGFYPAPTENECFKEELSPFKAGKGSVQFPLDKPMPLALISKIVKLRMLQDLEKYKKKKK
jgi:uncharacterized protein YdhG (YjbR/CyaY superfamily)